MKTDRFDTLCGEIIRIFFELDKMTAIFQDTAGLHCPSRCGTCCESRMVESSVIECLPLAMEICSRGQEEKIIGEINERLQQNIFKCVLYRSDNDLSGKGRCMYYEYRPLICRLFGFAARRNKYGKPEFLPCRFIGTALETSNRFDGTVGCGTTIPVYQDCYMRIALLQPAMGFRFFSINLAIKAALEYLYLKRPENFLLGKAA